MLPPAGFVKTSNPGFIVFDPQGCVVPTRKEDEVVVVVIDPVIIVRGRVGPRDPQQGENIVLKHIDRKLSTKHYADIRRMIPSLSVRVLIAGRHKERTENNPKLDLGIISLLSNIKQKQLIYIISRTQTLVIFMKVL